MKSKQRSSQYSVTGEKKDTKQKIRKVLNCVIMKTQYQHLWNIPNRVLKNLVLNIISEKTKVLKSII